MAKFINFLVARQSLLTLKSFKNSLAFTLAEVIIVMGIIGIIAEMTIPTLVKNVQRQQYISSVKKAYTTLSTAYALALQDNGSPVTWNLVGHGDAGGNQRFLGNLAPYLKITKNCGTNGTCFPNLNYKYLNGNSAGDFYSANPNFGTAQLADGTLLATEVYDKDCNEDFYIPETICAGATYDVNGPAGPNQIGVDVFDFGFTRNKVFPMGTPDSDTWISFEGCCDTTTTADKYGWSCAAWVLLNGNMDYLDCNGLSWAGKHTCN